MITRILFNFSILFSIFNCNNLTYKLISSYNKDHTSTIFLLKNNVKVDSILVNSYYGKDSIVPFAEGKWRYFYSKRCGSGCSMGDQIIFSIENDKLKESIHIEDYYKEITLGDETLKRYFKRVISIRKLNDELELKKLCLKNGTQFYSKTEKLFYDKGKQIYYNKKFAYEGVNYNGVKIDSAEYIYYKSKWYAFDNNTHKLYKGH